VSAVEELRSAWRIDLLDPKTGQLLRDHAPRGSYRIEDADRPNRTPPKTLVLLTAWT